MAPTKNKKRSSRNRSERSRQQQNVPATAIQYSGPIRSIAEKEQDDLIEVCMANYQALTSSAGGVLDTVFGNTPAGFPDWGNYAAVYHEYRILGFEIRFKAQNKYSKTTTTCSPGVLVKDRSSSGALASLSAGLAHASCQLIDLEDTWSGVLRMDSVEDATFKATASVTSDNWMKIYFSGLSVSTLYGTVFIWARIQFRGKL